MKLALKVFILLIFIAVTFVFWTMHRASVHEANAERAFPPEGTIMSVDGHPVHAVVIGQGPDLVLIHGAAGNTRDFTHSLAPQLAKHFRVYVFDRPGLGYTPPLNRTGATLQDQAALLSKAATQLGAQDPIVVGQSYGGAVALAWALHHPESISALVTLAGASHPWTTGLGTFYTLLSHPILGPMIIPILTAFVHDERVERELDAIFKPQKPPQGYAAHIGAGLTLRRVSLRENALQRANLLGEIIAQAPRYSEINVPTEILHGDADKTVGLHIHAQPLAQALPNAQLTVLEGIGHMPQHSAQHEVIDAIHRVAARAGLR